jgi:hypothetical protein
MSVLKNSVLNKIEYLHPCCDAAAWLSSYTSATKAWKECERGDWMLWLLGKLNGEPYSDARKKMVLCCCDCAELALPYAKDKSAKKCIEVARKWANGKATIEQLRTARNAAAAAAAYAAYAAAAAAADAAYAAIAAAAAAAIAAAAADAADAAAAAAAAADAAAYAAYADAAVARKDTLKKCANIVRKHYPKPPKVNATEDGEEDRTNYVFVAAD